MTICKVRSPSEWFSTGLKPEITISEYLASTGEPAMIPGDNQSIGSSDEVENSEEICAKLNEVEVN